MKNTDEKELHCLTCGKTIRLSRKIRICQNCRNRGKNFFLATGVTTVLGIFKKNSNK